MKRVLLRAVLALVLGLSVAPIGRVAFALGDPAYSADVPVTSQSEEERSAGLRAALGQVLARLSGDPGVATRADVAKALAAAPTFVQQYQYTRSADTAAEASHLLLNAQFDPVAVDDLLHRLHLSAATPETAGANNDAGTTLRVWISGMHSASDYARAMAALSGSDSVLSATPQRTHDDGLLVTVKLRSSSTRLLESLGAAQTLSPLPDAHLDGVDMQLAFRP